MEILGILLMAAGGLVTLAGGLWFLMVAFEEGIGWGLGCLLVPFVSLIFLVTHWDEAGKPFLVQLAGMVPFVLGTLLRLSGSQA